MAFVFEKRIENYVAAALVLLDHKGQDIYADVLRFGTYELEPKTGYDGWNGGQYSHTLHVVVPMNVFEPIADDLAECERILMETINKVSNDVENESLEAVGVSPDLNSSTTGGLEKVVAGTVVTTAFDEYVIDKQIGEGGNGRVFAAKSKSGELVAIKFLERDTAEKRKRFKNEIGFCEKCSHPNIVKVLDRGCIKINGVDRVFCVMPLYAESLRAKIQQGLSPEEAIAIFAELVQTLGEAHRHNVIHRDVKPENIMFAEGSKHPILCDFGIAHLPMETRETIVLTKPTDRMANFIYAAPEQKNGRSDLIGPQADLYAAGLILNEMFTRQVPSAEGYTRIGDVVPSYAFLDDVFSGLYQQDPARRLFPAEKVLAELRCRIAISNNESAKRKLSEVRTETERTEWQDLCVLKVSYEAPNLLFEMGGRIPDGWMLILNAGQFSHTSVFGCDTNVVSRIGEKTLVIPVSMQEDEGVIKQKVEYLREWVGVVNARYREELVAEVRREARQEEELRKQEIARLENENRIQRLVAKL